MVSWATTSRSGLDSESEFETESELAPEPESESESETGAEPTLGFVPRAAASGGT